MEHELNVGHADPENIHEHMRKTFHPPQKTFKERFKRMSVEYQRSIANHTKDYEDKSESPSNNNIRRGSQFFN